MTQLLAHPLIAGILIITFDFILSAIITGVIVLMQGNPTVDELNDL